MSERDSVANSVASFPLHSKTSLSTVPRVSSPGTTSCRTRTPSVRPYRPRLPAFSPAITPPARPLLQNQASANAPRLVCFSTVFSWNPDFWAGRKDLPDPRAAFLGENGSVSDAVKVAKAKAISKLGGAKTPELGKEQSAH